MFGAGQREGDVRSCSVEEVLLPLQRSLLCPRLCESRRSQRWIFIIFSAARQEFWMLACHVSYCPMPHQLGALCQVPECYCGQSAIVINRSIILRFKFYIDQMYISPLQDSTLEASGIVKTKTDKNRFLTSVCRQSCLQWYLTWLLKSSFKFSKYNPITFQPWSQLFTVN